MRGSVITIDYLREGTLLRWHGMRMQSRKVPPTPSLWRRLNYHKPGLVAGAVMACTAAQWAVLPVMVNALARMCFHKAVSCARPLLSAVAKGAQNRVHCLEVPAASADRATVTVRQTFFMGSRKSVHFCFY